MSDRDLSKEELEVELEKLRQEVAQLKQKEAALKAQSVLLENLVTMAGSSDTFDLIKAALQKTLDLAANLTGAEKGSLFLLDPNTGRVVDAILTRTEVTKEMRDRLIKSVFDKGLAGWTIRNRQLGLIMDTEKDDRWLTLPNQPYTVRSALAVPILRGEDLLGILTLLHSKPEHFSQDTGSIMQVTADRMALVLENTRLYSKIDEYAQALDEELEKGRQIQIDFLPYEIIEPPNWEIATSFHPAKQVAGDFYDTFELGNYLGVAIGDVCGKGVGAALFMALIRSLIRIFSGQTQLQGFNRVTNEELIQSVDKFEEADLDAIKPLQAIMLTDKYIAENHWQIGIFATMFFGVLNPVNGIITYINAGHLPLFLLGKSGIKKIFKSTGLPVGIMSNISNMSFKIEKIEMEPGDILFTYTDGVTEAQNPEGYLYTHERLKILCQQPATSASELLKRIETDLFAYMDDAPQFDDITMMAIRRLPRS